MQLQSRSERFYVDTHTPNQSTSSKEGLHMDNVDINTKLQPFINKANGFNEKTDITLAQ